MVMSDIQTEKKFQAKIPIAIWDEWEQWLDGRGSLTNTQIFCGLLRLFLASPESLQLKALFGRADELQVAESPAADTLSPEECEQIRQMFGQSLTVPSRQLRSERLEAGEVLSPLETDDLCRTIR